MSNFMSKHKILTASFAIVAAGCLIRALGSKRIKGILR